MDLVFKALSDSQRRHILDLLRQNDGQTLSALEAAFPHVTRFAVMKQLKILEAASLVTTRKEGRFKYHYLNPLPLQAIADRWISTFAAPWARDISQLKWTLEQETTMNAKPKHVFTTIIRTTPEALWDALTNPAKTPMYYYGYTVRNENKAGGRFDYEREGGPVEVFGEILELEKPKRLVISMEGRWMPGMENDPPSRVTYEIEQAGECCRLTLVHDGFESETATFKNVGGGWPGILSGLKTLLETGKPLNYDPIASHMAA